MNRRSFLVGTTAALAAASTRAPRAASVHVATNTYPWTTFAARDGATFTLHADASLAAIASSGVAGYEPIVESPEEVAPLGPRLKAHGLEMRSIYVNSRLHDDGAEASIAAVVAIGRAVAPLGTRIVVTNPSPIRWGGPENKTDAQIVAQGRALDRLGAKLRGMGLTLAYHNHDAELRAGAREFHHMLTATDPEHVKLCLDAHWVFRGASDSEVALFDVVEHYGTRIVELHLRQSRAGRWSEVFTGDGDIEYGRLSRWLRGRRLQPHLVLEQAVEDGSPRSMDVVNAHRQGLAHVLEVFAPQG
jgi:inosose dehydratase